VQFMMWHLLNILTQASISSGHLCVCSSLLSLYVCECVCVCVRAFRGRGGWCLGTLEGYVQCQWSRSGVNSWEREWEKERRMDIRENLVNIIGPWQNLTKGKFAPKTTTSWLLDDQSFLLSFSLFISFFPPLTSLTTGVSLQRMRSFVWDEIDLQPLNLIACPHSNHLDNQPAESSRSVRVCACVCVFVVKQSNHFIHSVHKTLMDKWQTFFGNVL